jgi:hypothetical protein
MKLSIDFLRSPEAELRFSQFFYVIARLKLYASYLSKPDP